LRYLIYIAFFLLIAAKCTHHEERIEGVLFSTSYNDCSDDYFEFGKIITIGDPGNKFMISLPYEWEIQETYTDTLYGMIASNHFEAMNNPEKFMLISVSGYQTSDSLDVYFKNEIKALKKDRSMDVLKAGKIDIKEQSGWWIQFKNEDAGIEIMNLVVYLKNPIKDEIYLIHTTVYMSDNYRERICYLKRLVNSFEIVELD